jgi:hypothetical protein
MCQYHGHLCQSILPHANPIEIDSPRLILQDTLWSALDDEQLRGRIYRFPQQKQVHFYRLVARGTPDIFLNNIAFDKGMLHQAFVGLDDNACAYIHSLLHSFNIILCSHTHHSGLVQWQIQ